MSSESRDSEFMALAIEQARIGRAEGGVPIGGALVVDGEVVAVGRNRRVQQNSAIRHGETDALESARPPARIGLPSSHDLHHPLAVRHVQRRDPPVGIPRVVMGENRTFVGGEDYLRSRGVEVVNLDSAECAELMNEFIIEHPGIWNQDIGEE
jgi:cytosine deaminase